MELVYFCPSAWSRKLQVCPRRAFPSTTNCNPELTETTGIHWAAVTRRAHVSYLVVSHLKEYNSQFTKDAKTPVHFRLH